MCQFQRREERFGKMISSFFTLFQDTGKFVNVMEDLTEQIQNKEGEFSQEQDGEKQKEIDQMLNELLLEVQKVEKERERDVLKEKGLVEDRKMKEWSK